MLFEEDEWRLLVEKLQRITDAGTARWDGEHEPFRLEVGYIQYAIGSVDRDGRPPYYLRISDADARQDVDMLQSEPLPDGPDQWVSSDSTPPLTAAQMIPRLFASAKRAATGGPAKFKELFAGLDSLDPEGEPPF